MLTAEEIVSRIEATAHADGRHTFVSGRLRVDAEYAEDLGRVFFRVNGTGALRGQVIRAIEQARLKPDRMVKALI